MGKKVIILGGDGVGPEVTNMACRVLEKLGAERFMEIAIITESMK